MDSALSLMVNTQKPQLVKLFSQANSFPLHYKFSLTSACEYLCAQQEICFLASSLQIPM